ncbi:ribosome biogenesis GTPase A [Corchorus olitorius]|uniref:Ribosome biogenesis GTPase A n=1 Tax=Corchorus olitorius TaxID=93759 RepID=A0A1R3KEL2_9ROSI|nr:ribosome biogenesis GTPase A [Corchorus olitorius]
MNPVQDHLIRQPVKRLETMFEKTFTSLFAYSLILVLTNVWEQKGEELLQDYEYENRAVIMHRMDGICRGSIICGALFVIKDIFRSGNKRKGSAHEHLKVWLNISLSIITGIVLILASGLVFAQGKVGIWARMNLGLLVISGVVVFRQLKHLAQFIDYIWMIDLFEVGDVVKIDYVDYEILDIRLVGCGEIPLSSEYELLRSFPLSRRIVVMNKMDLANPMYIKKGKLKHAMVSPQPAETKDITSKKPSQYLFVGILPLCAKLALTGATRDSLVGPKEVAQCFFAILNFSDQYKKWEKLLTNGGKLSFAESKQEHSGCSQLEGRQRKQSLMDHTQVWAPLLLIKLT